MQSHDKLLDLCKSCKAWTYDIRTQFTEFYELYKLQSNKVNTRDGWLVKLKAQSATVWVGGSAACILSSLSAFVERNMCADEIWIFTQYGKLLYIIDVTKLPAYIRAFPPIKTVALLDPNQQGINFHEPKAQVQAEIQTETSASHFHASIPQVDSPCEPPDTTGRGCNVEYQPNSLRPMGEG